VLCGAVTSNQQTNIFIHLIKSSDFSEYVNENTYGCCADHVTPSIRKKLALTSLTSGGRLVGIVRSRTKATEFNFSFFLDNITQQDAPPQE
jgi:hypothetical protein